MPKVFLACLLVCFGLTGCGQKDPTTRLLSKEDDALARQMIEALRTADYATATKIMDPKVFNGTTAQGLKRLHAVLDHGTPLEVANVGVWFQNSASTPEEPRRVTLTYQIHFPNRWTVAVIHLVEHSGANCVEAINMQPMSDSLEVLNRFTLAGKTPLHYVFLVTSVLVPAFILLVLLICIRSPIPPKYKWLWVILVLLGGGVFQLDWTTGRHDFQTWSILLLGSAVSHSSEHSPWIISVSLPVGAILFLFLRRSLMSPVQSPVPGE
jgi:hypothetical protein